MISRSHDGVDLWWELSGAGPVVALLPGRGDSSDLYPAMFSERLLAAGLGVLRIDPRDTGLSGDGGDSYTLSTMADDVVTVLDAAGVDTAHGIGLSMGGMVLCDLVDRCPHRVASVTFLSAMSPDPDAGIGPRFFGALGVEPVLGTLASMGSPTDDDRDWVIAEQLRADRRAPARPEAGDRHQRAAFRLGWPSLDQLADIRVHTLAIHGSVDLVLPVAHAEAFGRWIPGAALHVIDGMGHLPTRTEWDTIADLVISHVADGGSGPG